MILTARGNRAIFWGASVGDTYVTAELAFFGSSISNPKLKLSDHSTGEFVAKVVVPSDFCNHNYPRRVTHINMQIVH